MISCPLCGWDAERGLVEVYCTNPKCANFDRALAEAGTKEPCKPKPVIPKKTGRWFDGDAWDDDDWASWDDDGE
jgi:hypothetical protein